MAALTGLLGFPAFGGDGEGFVDLFNGSDLNGWTQRGGSAIYSIAGGSRMGSVILPGFSVHDYVVQLCNGAAQKLVGHPEGPLQSQYTRRR